jgi:signal transduction histidine kinase
MKRNGIAAKPSAGHDMMVAMNEALVLGSVRQHELIETSEHLNAQLRREIRERKVVEETLRTSEEALRRSQQEIKRHAGTLENEVTARTAELTATNKQLEAFVYSIAHDLRAPLRAMRGFSTMLVEEAGAALNETGKDCANRINKAAGFMDDMLLDLLAFSCISQQRVELTPVKLETVVESVLSRLQPVIQEKKARLENSGPWPVALAHEATLAQVVFNLVSNALKFMTPNVPPVVRLRTEDRAGFIRVWVEDNGPGIAPRHQGQIFGLFTRLEGEKFGGTGIGLAIVQKGVERMGGRAGVESELGAGSRFWVELQKA